MLLLDNINILLNNILMYILPLLIVNNKLVLIFKETNVLYTDVDINESSNIVFTNIKFILNNKPIEYGLRVKYNNFNINNIKILKKYNWVLSYINNKIEKSDITEINNQPIIDITNNINPYYLDKYTINNMDIIKLRHNDIIYKGMRSTTLNINNIDNLYARSFGWFTTNKGIAEKYTTDRRNNNWKIYSFKVIRNVNLLLLNKNNIKRIILKLEKMLIDNFIKETVDKINIIKALTGYNCNYKEQLEFLSNFDRKAKNKIDNRNKLLYAYNNNTRVKVKDDIYSHLHDDLNRISITTNLDRKLLDIICSLYNVDGYYNWNVPSIWEYGMYSDSPVMNEEIGLCIQRGNITKID
jgi:hypothetical protein